MTTKTRIADRDMAREKLADLIGRANDYNSKPTVYFIVRSVAPSGMSRVFSAYVIVDGEMRGIDTWLSMACGYTETRDGFRVHGCGMDMRFAVCDDMAIFCGDNPRGRVSGNDFDYRSL